MNKRIFNLTFALAFITVSTFANNITSSNSVGEKALIVDTHNWKSDNISIEIRDEEGAIIYKDNYSTQKNKKFNFENLPDGKYSITLSNELKLTKQWFTIKANNVNIQPNTETFFKPVIKINEQFIDLNYLASDPNTTVSIYDENNSIFNMRFKNEKKINRRFDTTSLPAGEYTFNVSSKNGSYTKIFRK